LASCRDEEEVEAEMTAALFETLQLALPLGIIQMILLVPHFHPLQNYIGLLVAGTTTKVS
jgi:hypothetical protein